MIYKAFESKIYINGIFDGGMIKAVIFDLDNTLIDFWKMKTNAVDCSLEAMIHAGLRMNKREARKELFELYYKYGIEYREIFQKFLLHTTGKIDYKILSKAVVAYRRAKFNLLMPYDGVKRTLDFLSRRYKLGIISDAPRMKAWVRLASMGIEDYFDVVVALEDTGKTKPHSLPFLKAIKKLGVKPGEVLMVGDNIKRDIVGGKVLGMKTAFARYGSLRKLNKNLKSNADYEIKRIEDLIRILG